MRTLEMKIADSGPPALRINPHIITDVRSEMVKQKRIIAVDKLWYHRATENPARVEARLIQLRSIYKKITKKDFVMRVGQTLEIAILRALEQSGAEFVGGFTDLDDHDDSTLYKKEEPPLRFSGHRMPGEKRFDFLAFHPTAGRLGIEAKNIREWIYPRRPEIKELISKSLAADAIPVLIGRRIPYVTFRLFQSCGMFVFENFNQLYPSSDAALAAEVIKKDDLGYHDVRAGNEPNARLTGFISSIGDNATEFRKRFNSHKDLLAEFAAGDMHYASFAARVRRRELGAPEDSDDVQDDPYAEESPDDIDWD